MNAYEKIRAALGVMSDYGTNPELRSRADEALTALAELEQTTGDPCPVCGWRTVLAWGCEKCERDELCKRMDALVELGREPTPEECERIAALHKDECAACCINPQESADYGRAMFDSVRAVMRGES